MLAKLTFKNTNPRFISDETDGAFILRPNLKDEFWNGMGLETGTTLLYIVPDEEVGFYWSSNFNFDYYLDYSCFELIVSSWKQNMGPDGFNVSEMTFSNAHLLKPMFGVADNIEQIKDYFAPAINNPNVELVVSVVELRKETQPPQGGWRWHKWGEYIGVQNPQREYLYDEPVIEKVIVFHGYYVEKKV